MPVDHKDARGRRIDGQGAGGWVEAEYAYQSISWLTPRAYAGALLTRRQPTSCGAGVEPCEVTARIAFAGGKVRLLAPFPWAAPFVESGLGASVGRFRTRSGAAADRSHGGLAYHVPLGLGLLLGRQCGLELCLQYLYHPRQWVTGGALALGLGFYLE